MGIFFSSSQVPEVNNNRQGFNRYYIAIDHSGNLGLLFDDYQDVVMGKAFNDVKIRSSKATDPIICEIDKGHTFPITNLLDLVEIDHLSQLSILSKVISPTGIASVIDYPRPINEFTRFIYYCQTSFDESCYDDIFMGEKASKLSTLETSATHIITEISWGVQFLVVLQLPTDETAEMDEFLKRICVILSDAEGHHVEMESIEKQYFDQIISTTVYSNIPELTTLTRLSDVYEELSRMSKNTTKHRRLRYTLSPLPIYLIDFNTKTEIDQQIKEMNSYLFWQYSQIKTLKFRVANELPMLSPSTLEEQWNNFQRELLRLTTFYENDAKKVYRSIHDMRKGESIIEPINQLINSEAKTQIKELIQQLTTSFNILLAKENFIKQLQNDKIEYYNVNRFGINRDCNEQLIKDILFGNNQKKMVFCTTDQLKPWDKLYDQIKQERKNNPQLAFVYADFTYGKWPLQKMIILLSKDQAMFASQPVLEVISSDQPVLEVTSSIQPVLEVTSSPSMDECINILLLGDSGVGKSTFINAFANYLRFDSLQQAQSGKPIVIIPVSFMLTINDSFDERRIKFGEADPNEQHNEDGQSVTQQCRSYVFQISPGRKLRIIDTPGFADTRGINHDEINMNMIFSYMNNLTHINAVCLLFKPTIPRLNPILYTCFSQIFQCFGETIRDHIIFCFTNARATFFAPGDTRPLLQSFLNSFPVKNIPLEKRNAFCFDSEAFRYLLALQDGFQFTDAHEDEMKNTWTRSVDESKRLRDFLCKDLEPSYTNIQWQSVLNAQYQINSMIRPMLETIRNILRNILLYDMDCSIKLKATCVSRSTMICYSCDRTPKILGQFRILPDCIHQSPNECSSNEQIPTEYTLDYEFLDRGSNESVDTLNTQIKFLCETCTKFAHFLQTTQGTKDDPFLSGLNRMLNEEESICEKVDERISNELLAIRLQPLIKDYQQSFHQTQFDLVLPNIYESIRLVNEIPMIKEQINAIQDYQQYLLKSSEHIIETETTSF